MIGYAEAGTWLEGYGSAWETFDGDAWVALFTDDAEYHGDPFGEPLVIGLDAPRLLAHVTDARVRKGAARRRIHRRASLGLGFDRPRGLARLVGRPDRRPARSLGRVHDRRHHRRWPGKPLP